MARFNGAAAARANAARQPRNPPRTGNSLLRFERQLTQ